MASTGTPSTHPKWFTPLRLLLIFCFTNLCVYLDRGLIASNGVNGSPRTTAQPEGTGIQGEFDLTYFQDGLLPTAFMVGLLVASVTFAEMCKKYSAFRLLGVGMGIWATACLFCGLAPNYSLLMVSRMLVGVGEASFVAMAAPFIDDYAPATSKAKWFAAFYLCIPVGFAAGYIVGGLIAPYFGWRATFMFEAAIMIPFVIFALTAEPLTLQGTADAKAQQAVPTVDSEGRLRAVRGRDWDGFMKAFGYDVSQVLSQRVWVLTCCAYTLYVAVIGVYAYWGPKAGFALFFDEGSQAQRADLVFGSVTVLTGVAGSVLGGVLLDKLGDSLRTACSICAFASLAGVTVVLPAFLASKSFNAFMVVFAIGQLILFLLQAPVVAIQMWCVPQPLRALGASLMTVSIHAFGDVPSPPLLGLLQTKLSEGLPHYEAAQKWRISMSLLSLLLVFSGLFFIAAAHSCTPAADFRTKKGAGSDDDKAPLLDDDQTDADQTDAASIADSQPV